MLSTCTPNGQLLRLQQLTGQWSCTEAAPSTPICSSGAAPPRTAASKGRCDSKGLLQGASAPPFPTRPRLEGPRWP